MDCTKGSWSENIVLRNTDGTASSKCRWPPMDYDNALHVLGSTLNPIMRLCLGFFRYWVKYRFGTTCAFQFRSSTRFAPRRACLNDKGGHLVSIEIRVHAHLMDLRRPPVSDFRQYTPCLPAWSSSCSWFHVGMPFAPGRR